MTHDFIYHRLNLKNPIDFQRFMMNENEKYIKRGYIKIDEIMRRTGRTTSMLINAYIDYINGERVIINCHTLHFTSYLRNEFNRIVNEIGEINNVHKIEPIIVCMSNKKMPNKQFYLNSFIIYNDHVIKGEY